MQLYQITHNCPQTPDTDVDEYVGQGIGDKHARSNLYSGTLTQDHQGNEATLVSAVDDLSFRISLYLVWQ